MRVTNIEGLEAEIIQLPNGAEVSIKRVVSSPAVHSKVAIVPPNSTVPSKDHKHENHEVLYILKGAAKLSDGRKTTEVGPGDIIVVEPFEKHYVVTREEELSIFEVSWK